MPPALLLTLGLMNQTPYEGITYRELCEIVDHRSLERIESTRHLLKAYGAYSPKSFPFYLKVLTTDSDDPSVPSKERWAKLQLEVLWNLVPNAEGDRSMFVPVGIDHISRPGDVGWHVFAQIMLAQIATRKDAPAVAKVISLDDPKRVRNSMEAAKVLSVIGGKEELELLNQLVASKHVQADEMALEHITAARDMLAKRLKATPPEKKDK